MMKTVALIASCDTKSQEVEFIRQFFAKIPVFLLVVDISIGSGEYPQGDITREEVAQSVGISWKCIQKQSKSQLMKFMTDAVKATVLHLYEEGKIHGVLGLGGVQNTTVATQAMQALPIGIPKVMATTIASGQRSFFSVVGKKDILTLPSIGDFSGINSLTKTILSNACGAICGMVQYAGEPLERSGKPVVGITLMGVTNTAACAAIQELERLGIEAIGFHATGVGGAVMEQLAAQRFLDGILDLTTHELTAEYFGGGFSFGTQKRLVQSVLLGIPMVVSVGGLDFIDYPIDTILPEMESRICNAHNAQLAHIKILPREAESIGQMFAKRLNKAKGPVSVLLPTNGMRCDTRPGESLNCKESDDALLDSIRLHLSPHIPVSVLEGNLNEEEWGIRAAQIMADMLLRRCSGKGER